MTTSNSRQPKVTSLIEPREETWDGKAERKDGTGHRFDRWGRPARRSQTRASRRARAGAWPRCGEVLASSPTSRPAAARLISLRPHLERCVGRFRLRDGPKFHD